MEIINVQDPKAVFKAVECLQKGGLVFYPTETCYGAGVDATNNDAVSKLLSFKKRPIGKAISIATDSREMASIYVNANNTALEIYSKFLPGPVTVISKSNGKVDKRLESENGSLGIRIPNYSIATKIINKLGKPITATSANPAGAKTPYSVNDILETLSENQKELIDLIIDAGELPHNPPSTVIDTTTEELTSYRAGRINLTEEIEIFDSKSEHDTIDIGFEITKRYIQSSAKPIVFLLDGEMGSGKTHFTKGVAKALGIDRIIKSPTYTYVSEYKYDKGILYHFDAWRVTTKEDLAALKFESWLVPGNIIVIEWPSVITNLGIDISQKTNGVWIEFIIKSDHERTLRIFKSEET